MVIGGFFFFIKHTTTGKFYLFRNIPPMEFKPFLRWAMVCNFIKKLDIREVTCMGALLSYMTYLSEGKKWTSWA